MNCFNDKTYCASLTCKNKCGRKMSSNEKSKLGRNDLVSYAYFCDENGEVPHKQTQRTKGGEFERFSYTDEKK